ncbi:hypothetical protein D3C83_236930 [compost metagenome]
MNTDELAAMKMPNSIGTAKLSTALPPAIAIGSRERKAVTEVYRLRASVSLMLLSIRSRRLICL